jgi:lipocalin
MLLFSALVFWFVFVNSKQIPNVITDINVDSYLGHWTQLYQAPTNVIFQGYGTCITADYGLLENGNINVINTQLDENSEIEQITGYGYYKNVSEPGKLTVHLEGVPVDSPYWIVKLGEIKDNQYQYSIITIPSGISLWVLVRDIDVFMELYNKEVVDFLNQYNFKYTTVLQENCNYKLTTSSITRDQIMQRAQVWVDEKIPYSQSATTNGYRQDCSGYVSYAWASSTSGGGHWTGNMQEICTKISKADMKKGDAILKPESHVLLFGGWIDSDAFYEYAEHQPGDVCRKSTGSYNYFATNGYFPCRYNLVSN